MPSHPFAFPDKWFLKQAPMLRVCWALLPLLVAATALFGWRAPALTLVALLCGLVTEAFFAFPKNQPVSSAVLVTGLIFALSLPPTLPFWMATVGMVFAVSFGKMVFGGFGRNVFNPAMVGRAFLYVTFPLQMTNSWTEPAPSLSAGFLQWTASPDGLTGATTLTRLKEGVPPPDLADLFFGFTAGSLGETSALLILLGGGYLLWKKVASWRLLLSCLAGGLTTLMLGRAVGTAAAAAPLASLLSGSFLFGAVFVVTEPVSAAKTPAGQVLYGFFIGALTIVLRLFSNFPEGMMFAVLLANGLAPLVDLGIRALPARREVAG